MFFLRLDAFISMDMVCDLGFLRWSWSWHILCLSFVSAQWSGPQHKMFLSALLHKKSWVYCALLTSQSWPIRILGTMCPTPKPQVPLSQPPKPKELSPNLIKVVQVPPLNPKSPCPPLMRGCRPRVALEESSRYKWSQFSIRQWPSLSSPVTLSRKWPQVGVASDSSACMDDATSLKDLDEILGF